MAVATEALFQDDESGTLGSMGMDTVPSSLRTKHDRAFARPAAQMTFNEQATVIVAAFTIVLAIATMIIEGTAFAIFAGLLSMVMGMYSHYQQTQVVKVGIFRKNADRLRREIAQFKDENVRLKYYAEELDGRVEDLVDVEDALKIVTEANSIDALQNDADANLEAVCKLRQSVKTSVIETLVSFFYSRQDESEIDGNTPITEEETTKMIQKLQNITGLSLDENLLRETLVGNSIESIIDALLNLLNEDIPAMSRIFHLKRSL
eukprot:CAMPEP_0116139036 /NCGR_PEP_ID=MMETSP0329-20121206/13091_1 /TAXON_ID=697910 /ORGANISM="Pseudo-nitzschia arenysensis, Strain B593" /LENGTH=262 /DNA_ID=CAMNT_0003634039 /DNA_START=52 /DNA_END=840 /DNA_ORIENTATION=-